MSPEESVGLDIDMICEIYKTIMDMSGDGFLVIDKEGKIIDINKAYVLKLEGVNGLKREEILGRYILDYIPTSLLTDFIHVEKPIQKIDTQQEIADKFQKNVGEKHLISTRATVYSERYGVMGAVAQVKFFDQVIRLSNRIKQIDQELNYYKNKLADISLKQTAEPNDSMLSIIGVSDAITKAKSEITKAAAVDFNTFILGETGSGKEMFAAAVHNASNRANGPFIKLNCSAIPSELFESELFGYTEGSFTGALKHGKKGKFEQANGGTILLDEICDMPMAMQAKLLRVLQEKEIDVIGGSEPRPIDVRVIAATNKDPAECIQKKTFRSDLYFRLNVMQIVVPPLRERKEDISLLAEHFLRNLNMQYKTETRFSGIVIDILEGYDWPGNVRELINFVERMYAYAEDGIINIKHIPFLIQDAHIKNNRRGTLHTQIEEAERAIIMDALEANKYNFKRTAEYLGIHRSTLYNKVEYYSLNRDQRI